MSDFLDKSDHIRDALFDVSDEDDSFGEVIGSDSEIDIFGSDNESSISNRAGTSTNGETSTTDTIEHLGDLSNHIDDYVAENFPNPVNNANVTISCPVCKWDHNDDYEPPVRNFDSSKSKVLVFDELRGREWKEIDAFYEMFDFDFMSHIAQETNKYYKECCKGVLPEFSKLNKWTPTNADELYCFFATTLLMSHCKKNTLKQYWSTDPLIATPIFSKIFTQDRYLLLRRLLHFDDNSNSNGNDKLSKIRTVVETLRRKYRSLLQPYQNLVIDESLMLWKGRLSFRQYLPNKRKRFGVKLFVLCDCQTGIILDFIIYTGKGTNVGCEDDKDSGLSSKVVKTLMEPYLNNNHTIFMDNWYSSPDLFSWLDENNTGACGTVNPKRKNLPCLAKKMKPGDVSVRNKGNMITVKWCDKRPVTVLSTVDKHSMVSVDTRSHKGVLKPKCVLNYNSNMGSVDKSDMMISYNDSTRKGQKWYIKLFFHLLDLSVLNAYYLYR